MFTSEEIYDLISKDGNSIHENLFVKVPLNWKNDILKKKWLKLFELKQEANIAIENKRANKEIGSSLEAHIKFDLDKEKFELLDNLNLAEYFITSKAEKKLISNGKIKIEVRKAEGKNVKDVGKS